MNSEAKTIFITSFHGFLSRVLSAGLLSEILNKTTYNVVIFVYDFKKDFYEKEFSSNRVKIEPVDHKNIPRLSSFFSGLAFMLLNSGTMKIKNKSKLKNDHNYLTFLFKKLISFLGGFKLVRYIFRKINYFFSDKYFFKKQFDFYRPELVLSLDIKHLFDTQILMEAKSRKIKTMGMVRSWDNLTSKGVLRILPEKLIVHNNLIKEEAVYYNDVNPDNIFIVGVPHYDIYHSFNAMDKSIFLKNLGLESDKKTILFAPMGSRFCDTDWQIIKILKEARKNSLIPKNVQFIIRMPPTDNINLEELSLDKSFFIDNPGTDIKLAGIKNKEMTTDDAIYLANSLINSDVVITGLSTLLIDSMIFDKPTIAIGFNGNEKKNYHQSVIRYFDYDHLVNLKKTRGMRISSSKEDLIKFINLYLEDNNLDEKFRREAVRQQCYLLDGRASERIVNVLLR